METPGVGSANRNNNQSGFTDVDSTPSVPVQSVFTEGGFTPNDSAVPSKRIVILCDGTWQSSVTGLKNIPSNITRLARSIARSGKDKNGKIWQQVAYYDEGIGTGDLSIFEKDRQGGLGIGLVGNVIQCYNFIVMNYSLGDEIFCFGYSRGAYTARAVAGLVNDIGVISSRNMQDFPELYALYQKNEDSNGFRKSEAYRRWVNGVLSEDQPTNDADPPQYKEPPHFLPPESSRSVQVVGVFDTVGSLGIPKMPYLNLDWLRNALGMAKVSFHNVKLSPYIRHAFHALAIDERRGAFQPTLWHYPASGDLTTRPPTKSRQQLDEEYKAALKSQAMAEEKGKEISAAWSALIDHDMHAVLQGNKPVLLQVWFPGVHINVGGGSDDILKEQNGDFEQIAMITFAWMCEQIEPYLQLDPDLESRTLEDRRNDLRSAMDAIQSGELDNCSSWWISRVWAGLDLHHLKETAVRKLSDGVDNGWPGWATGPIVEAEGLTSWGPPSVRTPGQYLEDKTMRPPIKLGKTEEMIHPCVAYRMSRTGYAPKALAGFSRTPDPTKTDGKSSKSYKWTKGQVKIEEYVIKPEHRFSRHLVLQDKQASGDQAPDFIGRIDEALK